MAKIKYIGDENNPISLEEISVYPNTIYLETYKPLNAKYLPGHSILHMSSENPTLNSAHVTGRFKNADYNFITNNCSDATRKVLESAFRETIDPFLFTTPGDTRDFFIKHGAIKTDSDNGTRHVLNVDEETYRRALRTAKYVNRQHRKRNNF